MDAKRRALQIGALIRRGLTVDQAVHFEQKIAELAEMARDGGLHATQMELLSRALAREIKAAIEANAKERQ